MKHSDLTDSRTFNRLLNELKCAQPGHLYPVLYTDESAVPVITEHLKSELNGKAVLKHLQISPQHFSYDPEKDTAESSMKTVFYLKGADLISDKTRINAVGYLQTFLSQAENLNCSLLLWITPLLERMFFFSSTDLYQKITSAYDFTETEAAAGEKKSAASAGFPSKFASQAADRLRMIVRQYHDWQKTADTDKDFLLRPMSRSDIKNNGLPLYFTNRSGRTFLLDQLFKVFLQTKSVQMLTLLGNSHTGKTAFTVKMFIRLAEKYIENPEKAAVPIFFDLEKAEGLLAIEAYLLNQLESVYRIRISAAQLYEMLAEKQFVFLVNGFDQMNACSDELIIRQNFEALYRLSFAFLPPRNGHPRLPHKIFVTSQPHLFLPDVLRKETDHEYTSVYASFAARKECQLIQTAPPRFDPLQAKAFIIANTGSGITARNLLAVLNNPYFQNTLSSLPLMWEMTIRAVSKLQNKKEVTIADLYSAFTGLWIERNSWRSRLTDEGRKALIHQIAGSMTENGDSLSTRISRLSPPSDRHIQKEVNGEDHIFEEDLKCCEFISLDANGNIRFIHPSFLHYFSADHCFQAIRNGQDREPQALPMPEEANMFLKAVVSSEKTGLKRLNLSGLDLSGANLYNADMAEADLSKAHLTRTVLMHADLHGADLTAAVLKRARMSRVNLKGADLTGADFSEANLKDADLRKAGFNGASFQGADLRGVKLQGAKLAWVDLSQADLRGADLSGANLSDADLAGADLTDACLNEAELTNADLRKAVLKNADISFADLSHADLTGANLYHVNCSWSKFQGAVLTRAILRRARLRETDFTRANLNDADLHRADGRWAKFTHARLKNVMIREADFTGADFQHASLTGADLTWINLSKARLEHSDMSNAKLNMAKMMEAGLQKTNLSRADLTWADLTGADLSRAVLKEANLSEADLTNTVFKNTDLKTVNLKGTMLENNKDGENRNGDI